MNIYMNFLKAFRINCLCLVPPKISMQFGPAFVHYARNWHKDVQGNVPLCNCFPHTVAGTIILAI